MKKSDYFRYALTHNLLDKLDWYYNVMSIPPSEMYETEYLLFRDGYFYVKIDDRNEHIEDSVKGQPLFTLSDSLTLTNGNMVNIDNKVETTFGIAVANYILLVSNFKDKIPYINGPVKINYIESIIEKKLSDEIKNKDDISVKEYLSFIDSVTFIQSFSRLVSVAATYKNVVAPKGIVEYKKKLIKEFKEKYGEDVFKDYAKVAEFENKLREYDSEWMKGDPSDGKVVSGKVKNVARTKMYLTYGAEVAFDTEGEANLVENSLDEGWPKDPELLAMMYNASRAGSYNRGAETQKGGLLGKILLRATSSFKIVEGDCGTSLGRNIYINKEMAKSMVGRYSISNSKLITITEDNLNSYIDKIVTVRSPAYCKLEGSKICTTCVGNKMKDYKTSIPLLMTNIGNIILYQAMGAMHGKQLKTVKVTMSDILK